MVKYRNPFMFTYFPLFSFCTVGTTTESKVSDLFIKWGKKCSVFDTLASTLKENILNTHTFEIWFQLGKFRQTGAGWAQPYLWTVMEHIKPTRNSFFQVYKSYRVKCHSPGILARRIHHVLKFWVKDHYR